MGEPLIKHLQKMQVLVEGFALTSYPNTNSCNISNGANSG